MADNSLQPNCTQCEYYESQHNCSKWGFLAHGHDEYDSCANFENREIVDPKIIECCGPNGTHEYAEKECPKCKVIFCFSCSADTNVHEGGKYERDYMLCPICGHDFYQIDKI